MSLLTMAQAVADEVGIASPATVIGNTALETVRLKAAIYASMKFFALKNWSFLHKLHTFSTVASTQSYALPTDFERLVLRTEWNRTDQQRLLGPYSAYAWQISESGSYDPTRDYAYRIKPDTGVNKMYLDNTPSGVHVIAYEYISTYLGIQNSDSSEITTLTSDADTPKFSEFLVERESKWRWLESMGFAYQRAQKDAEDLLADVFGNDGGVMVLSMNGSPIIKSNIPERNWNL
jgi:hypothetical protein